jgi:hypothetical protein
MANCVKWNVWLHKKSGPARERGVRFQEKRSLGVSGTGFGGDPGFACNVLKRGELWGMQIFLKVCDWKNVGSEVGGWDRFRRIK